MYSLELITAPSEQPITLAEAKKQVEVATAITHHDDHLTRLIKAATQHAETYTHRQLLTAVYEINIDRFPADSERIDIPLPPLAWDAANNWVKYYDVDGDQQTLSTDVYKVLDNQEPGQIALKYGQSWPSVYAEAESVTIRFSAGYADTAAELADSEELLKAALLLLVEAFWRRDYDQTYAKQIKAAEALLEQYCPGDEFVEYTIE